MGVRLSAIASVGGVAVVAFACGLDARGTCADCDRESSGGPRDGSAIVPPERDASLPSEDASSTDAAMGSDAGCPGTAGPPGVRIGAVCIDRTEVTERQYSLFLVSGTTLPQPPLCAWNTSFGTANTSSDLPMVNVDWCDAHAFCAWAGKRLCTREEWRSACSDGDKYPYGATYQQGRCNDLNHGVNGRVAVASLTCAGAAGVHDMIGNVWEWIDGCTGASGAIDPCPFSNGGAYGHLWDCDQTASGFVRSSKAGDVGFRCCAP